MSAPRNIPDLQHDEPAESAIRKILTIRHGEIATERDAFLNDRVPEMSRKSVHALRVSLRRQQAFLNVFHDALPRKKATNVRKYLRKALRALGPIREHDVFASLLHQYALTIPAGKRTALFLLAGKIQHKRDSDVKPLRGDIRSILGKGWEEESATLFNALDRRSASSDDVSAGPSVPFARLAAETLLIHIRQLIVEGDRAIRRSDGTELHDVRVDTKPLRYILETLKQIFPLLEEHYGELRHFVGLLGELHDGELLLPLLEVQKGDIQAYNRLAKSSETPDINTVGLGMLSEDILQRRTKLVGETGAMLRRWKRHAIGTRIGEIILPS